MAQTSCRHLREVAGVDYSLIDYQGMLAAAGQVTLAWWIDLPRSLAAQAQEERAKPEQRVEVRFEDRRNGAGVS